MIIVKNKAALQKMAIAGEKLAAIFKKIKTEIVPGVTTYDLDQFVIKELKESGLVSRSKGYLGYQHVTCISVNDVVVHGVPSKKTILKPGDLVTIDICASWKGYCSDMARCFFVGEGSPVARKLVAVAQQALDKGIDKARVGNHLSDISAAIQVEVEKNGFGVVRDFAGHGIGKSLHEEPELVNYGKPGKGPILQAGMTLAIEPMITEGGYEVYVTEDGWTVRTEDKKLSAHVEDTVVITLNGPKILTRT